MGSFQISVPHQLVRAILGEKHAHAGLRQFRRQTLGVECPRQIGAQLGFRVRRTVSLHEKAGTEISQCSRFLREA